MDRRAEIGTEIAGITAKSPHMAAQMKEQLNMQLDRVSQYIGMPNLTSEQKQEIVNTKQLASTIKNFGVNLGTYSEDIRTQIQNQGKMGGQDPSFSTGLTETFLGISGASSVKGKSFYKMDNSGTEGPVVMVGFQKEGQENINWVNSNQLNELATSGSGNAIAVIPDASGEMKEMINQAMFGNPEGKGNINPRFYQDQSGERVRDIKNADGKRVGEIQSVKPNIDLLKKEISQTALAAVSNTAISNQDKVSLYNFFQAKANGNKAEFLDHEDLMSEEETTKLASMYTDYATEMYLPSNSIKEQQAAITPQSNSSEGSKNKSKAQDRALRIYKENQEALNKKDGSKLNGVKFGKSEIIDASFQPREFVEYDEKDKENTGKYINKEGKAGSILTFTTKKLSGNTEFTDVHEFDLSDPKDYKLFLNEQARGLFGPDETTDIMFGEFAEILNNNKPKGTRFGSGGSSGFAG